MVGIKGAPSICLLSSKLYVGLTLVQNNVNAILNININWVSFLVDFQDLLEELNERWKNLLCGNLNL
jgi:hypothetical protein